MNVTLNRTQYRADGIFGELRSDTNHKVLSFILEHAYLQDDGSYQPKVPPGVYTCKRGDHKLHNMVNAFTTFEVLNVPNHSGILFHIGNYCADSDGCLLMGEAIVPSSKGQMITQSKANFADFMKLQDGLDSFQLTVT